MGYSYLLLVDEDLDKLEVPQPSDAEVLAAWAEQGGSASPPAEVEPHVRSALRKRWLAVHRQERLAPVDEALRFAGDRLGWRPLLEDESVTAILATGGYEGLHRSFYSERADAWFDSVVALARVTYVRAHPEYSGLDDAVRAELDALERALVHCASRRLRFRFDFCP